MKENSFLSYFICFLLIAQAGFPFFIGDKWLLIITGITAIFFFNKSKEFNHFIIYFVFAFIFLMLLQVVFSGNFIVGPFLGILLRIVFAFMAIKVIGLNFAKYYIDIIYVLTIIGLALWLVLAFVPNMYNIASSISKTIIQPLELFKDHARDNLIFYTNEYWLKDLPPRNAGPFWEPGGNGVFLIVALLFNTLKTQKLLDKKNIVFFIAVFSTFSLGAYSSLMIFVFLYLFLIKNIQPSTLIISLAIIFYGYYAYNKYDFLGKKLETRVEKANTLDKDVTYESLDYRVGRNEQVKLDLRAFIRHPIFGEGQFIIYEYGASASGLTALLRKWGIFGFLLVFGSMYKSFKRYTLIQQIDKKYAFIALITLMAVALSQSLYGKPLFLGFSFLYLAFTKQEILLNLTQNSLETKTD